MHMGIVLFYLGLCCAINSLITLVIPCLFLIFAQIVAVYIDEPRLKRDFPEEYSQWVQKYLKGFGLNLKKADYKRRFS